ELSDGSRRVLVPLAATEIGSDEVRLRWTAEQLHAQPSVVSDDLLPRGRFTGEPPAPAEWIPARPSVIPPGVGANRPRAARDALLGGAIGTGLGALLGLAAGGLTIAVALALFLGAGGGIAGAIAGASRESATDASELDDSGMTTTAGTWRVHGLERMLRDERLF